MGREVMEGLSFLTSLPLAGTGQREGGGFCCINKWITSHPVMYDEGGIETSEPSRSEERKWDEEEFGEQVTRYLARIIELSISLGIAILEQCGRQLLRVMENPGQTLFGSSVNKSINLLKVRLQRNTITMYLVHGACQFCEFVRGQSWVYIGTPPHHLALKSMWSTKDISKSPHQLMTYHSPPEGVGVAGEIWLEGVWSHGVLLGEVYEVTGEYEAEEADVERRDQLLKMRNNWI